MNRIISILLISLLTVSVYAYEPEYPYSVISTRHYGAYGETEQEDNSHNPYRSSYGVHTSTLGDSYHGTYGNDYKADRISANTFSATPSMEITTMLSPAEDGNSYGSSSSIRPPQRTEGEGDNKPGTGENQEGENWDDPYGTPPGDIPWLLMAILAGAFAFFSARKHRVEKRQ